nr:DUF4253 domain-containing protein [Bacillus thuringiensis]
MQPTNGVNYEVSNKDVIFKLRKWNDRYPFIIISADYDWVDTIFSVLPTDVEEIKKTKKLFYGGINHN